MTSGGGIYRNIQETVIEKCRIYRINISPIPQFNHQLKQPNNNHFLPTNFSIQTLQHHSSRCVPLPLPLFSSRLLSPLSLPSPRRMSGSTTSPSAGHLAPTPASNPSPSTSRPQPSSTARLRTPRCPQLSPSALTAAPTSSSWSLPRETVPSLVSSSSADSAMGKFCRNSILQKKKKNEKH